MESSSGVEQQTVNLRVVSSNLTSPANLERSTMDLITPVKNSLRERGINLRKKIHDETIKESMEAIDTAFYQLLKSYGDIRAITNYIATFQDKDISGWNAAQIEKWNEFEEITLKMLPNASGEECLQFFLDALVRISWGATEIAILKKKSEIITEQFKSYNPCYKEHRNTHWVMNHIGEYFRLGDDKKFHLHTDSCYAVIKSCMDGAWHLTLDFNSAWAEYNGHKNGIQLQGHSAQASASEGDRGISRG